MRLTDKGQGVRDAVDALFSRHAQGMESRGVLGLDSIEDVNTMLRRMERYWTDQIRYIY